MQHCSENVLRILQFVVNECEVLPSSAKAPFVLTVELLQQDFSCQSEKLYTQGHIVGMTSLDYIQGRMIPFHPHSFGIRRRHKKNLMLNQKPCEILENSHSDDVKDLGCTDFFDPLASNFQQVEFKDGEKSAESKEEFTVSDVCNGND